MISANGAVTLRDFDLEERKALLASGSDEPNLPVDDTEHKHGWSGRRIALTALAIMLLMHCVCYRTGSPGQKQQPASSSILRSNGTHEFKPTVLVVSIDGLRYVLSCQTTGSM